MYIIFTLLQTPTIQDPYRGNHYIQDNFSLLHTLQIKSLSLEIMFAKY